MSKRRGERPNLREREQRKGRKESGRAEERERESGGERANTKPAKVV